MKFSFKGIVFELDHATFIAILGGIGMYVKALTVDFLLSKNKNIASNNIVDLGINAIKGAKK